MTTHYNLKDVEQIENYYRGHVPYCKETTGSSVKIIAGKDRSFFCDGQNFRPVHFQMIKQIKATGDGYTGPGGQPVYNDFNPLPWGANAGSLDAYELDLSKAYLTAAKRLKVFPRGLIGKISSQPKEFRLRLLGCLAVRKAVVFYDKFGKQTDFQERFSKGGVNLWRQICWQVGNDMAATSREDQGFLAFWVDNYFTTNRKAAQLLRERGYRVKSKKINVEYRLEAHGAEFIVDGCRPFLFSRHNSYTQPKLKQLQANAKKYVDSLQRK